MVTSDNEGPGTSTPCQKPIVANKQECSSELNTSTNLGFGKSDWVNIFHGTRWRTTSAAAFMARQLVNSASARPCAASISDTSSSCIEASKSAARGSGRSTGQ